METSQVLELAAAEETETPDDQVEAAEDGAEEPGAGDRDGEFEVQPGGEAMDAEPVDADADLQADRPGPEPDTEPGL